MEYKNPYLFFCNAIGDYIMALPTLRALNNIFNGRLSIIYNKSKINSHIMSELNVKKVIEIEFQHIDDERRFDPDSVAEQIKNCDLFLYLNTWINEIDIRRLLDQLPHLKKSVGYYPYFTDQISYSTSIHNFDLYFRMVHVFDKDLSIEDFSYAPQFDENYNKRIAPLVIQNKTRGIKYLAVHFDSEPEKSLNRNIYEVFLEKILETYPDIYLVPIGLDDIELQKKHHKRILNFGRPLPFLIATAYLQAADFFIGVDSCFLHISDLHSIPSIGIFGPTSAVEFGFRFNEKYSHICPETKNLKDINTNEIYKRFNELLNA
jgi:ADP-heptose:LPS heptosyltransferase